MSQAVGQGQSSRFNRGDHDSHLVGIGCGSSLSYRAVRSTLEAQKKRSGFFELHRVNSKEQSIQTGENIKNVVTEEKKRGDWVLYKRQLVQGLKSPIKEGLRRWILWSNSGGILARSYLGEFQILFPGAGFLNFYFSAEIQPDPVLSYVVQRFVHPDDLIIDVGANIGLSVFLFSKQIRNGKGRIVALEPSKEPRQFLKANCALNELSCVSILPMGAGEKEAAAELFSHACDGNRSSSILEEFVVEGASSSEEIQLTTLDVVIAREGVPSLIKIDVEGFECSVLSGLSHPEVWAQTVLFVEVRSSTFQVVVELLVERQCDVFFVKDNRLEPIEGLDQELYFFDHLAVIDIVGVPKGRSY